jgi:hypothetical protein
MLKKIAAATLGFSLVALGVACAEEQDPQLAFPTGYREWIYLSTGLDMAYNPRFSSPDHHMFDNVFVDPKSYQEFVRTGHWPDKTMFVLEVRGASNRTELNKAGFFQDPEVMGVEVHMRDDKRFSGKWAFFAFDGKEPATKIPDVADCYSCHKEHGAVDTTFVQFYPTLFPIAQEKQTFSAGYKARHGG